MSFTGPSVGPGQCICFSLSYYSLVISMMRAHYQVCINFFIVLLALDQLVLQCIVDWYIERLSF